MNWRYLGMAWLCAVFILAFNNGWGVDWMNYACFQGCADPFVFFSWVFLIGMGLTLIVCGLFAMFYFWTNKLRGCLFLMIIVLGGGWLLTMAESKGAMVFSNGPLMYALAVISICSSLGAIMAFPELKPPEPKR